MNTHSLLQMAALTASLGLSVAVFRERLLQTWLFLGAMLLLATSAGISCEALSATSAAGVAYWYSLTLAAKAAASGFLLCFSFVYARGNPKDYLRRHRLPLAAAIMAPLVVVVFFGKNLVSVSGDVPPAQGWWLAYQFPAKLLNGLLLLGYIGVLMNLEATFRASVGTMRWRIKFATLGLGAMLGIRVYTRSQALLFSGESVAVEQIEAAGLLVGCILMAVAAVRGGFSPLDIYPASALVRHSWTIVLTAGYFLIIGVFAQVVTFLGGAENLPAQAFLVLIGIVGIFILLLSDRLRESLRRRLSRWFHRPLHDFRRVWTQFSERLTSELSPQGYCRTAATLIAEIFNTLSVTFWLVDERRQRLLIGASTSTLALEAAKTDPDFPDSQPIIQHLPAHRAPFNLERISEPWGVTLRRMNAKQFPHGGDRFCLPLLAGDRCIGLAVFADRANGAPYSLEELDLLACIGGQISAGLLNLRLTEDLMRAKELEAFQTMSAFFVHDLKNAASTLNLMLQNLPVHFDNPEFRADTLRGIGNTVSRINQLITRLGVFRSQLELKLSDSDLNGIVLKALAGFDDQGTVKLEKDLRPLPTVRMDAEQIESVVTNLLINAREAIDSEGTIRIETAHHGDTISLSVVDNGSGMSAEFLAVHLFRPFHSTKKKGLGVGMFQAKTIVEAHRGMIHVESEVGSGSAFRIVLPLRAA
jgi:putative PEP-CTERM system histidine kinase